MIHVLNSHASMKKLAFKHPIILVLILLLAASVSIVSRTCNKAFKPSSSINLRTKLCGCVLRALEVPKLLADWFELSLTRRQARETFYSVPPLLALARLVSLLVV
ncbi:hypothetical protein ALC53_00205 [Atta colombica]|uniref:Uncharacterized protein n=1 Tax=Atta colombica TaxID=520822 RepID=A0A195BX98_9HYME|nr:hypothetical protein ALC53_00205 [Atta colombica]